MGIRLFIRVQFVSMADTPEIKSDKDQPSNLNKVDMDLGISSDNLSLVRLTKRAALEEIPVLG